jgi:hypothetical protein
MTKAATKTLVLFVGCFGFSILSNAQPTRVRGIVKDAETGEPISYASVYIKGTSVFAYTNDSGAYSIETRLKVDSISVSFLGYISQSEEISRRVTQIVNFNLRSNVTRLDAIVVVPGENPAHRILRAINKNKEKNALKSINYQCNKYSKVHIALSNIDETFKNRRVLKPFKFVFDNVDTNAYTGNTYLPILVAETSSDFYYQKDPYIEKETVQATKISGIQNESVLSFLGGLNQSFNIYDDFMSFYSESGFISPIAGTGLLFYKYYLLDSATLDGHKCYNISFKPRRKQERTFVGEFWVADSSFAIRSMSMRINPQANLNFITDMYSEYSYAPVNDSIWLLKREYIQADLNIAESKRIKGLQGTKTIIYSHYKINEPIPDNIKNRSEKILITDSASSPGTIEKIRPVELSNREAKIYKMVDSIKNVPAFRTAYDIIQTLTEGHYELGKFNLGPYYSVYSYNKVEGHRFRIGGYTNANFSKRVQFDGFMAYGTYDKEFKYYADMLWIIKKSPFIRLTTIFRHDISQVNLDPGEPFYENIFSSYLRRYPFTKLQLIDNAAMRLETDLTNSITNILSINLVKVHVGPYIPFIQKTDSIAIDNINSAELGLGFHIEAGQKFFNTRFRRVRLRNDNPAFDLNITGGVKGLFNGDYNYIKYSVKMSQYLKTNPIGHNRYFIEVGKISGSAPWPLLNVFRGNESYGLSREAFNLMNYYEFIADEFITINTEQHFQGIFFNYIPLLRKLKLREVASVKATIGHLNNNQTQGLLLPSFTYGLDNPYIEAGLGIENIFKFVRVDAVWRVTHQDHPSIEIFGLRINVHFML